MFWMFFSIILGVILLGVILFFLYSFLISNYIVNLFVHPKYHSREEQIQTANHESWPGYFDLEKKPFELKLRDGKIINGDISLNNNSHKFMILCHGHGSTREGSTKYALMYYKFGYSIVRYDARGHGDNERCLCSMGMEESRDLDELITFIKSKYEDATIALHGSSMGGATVLLVTRFRQDIRYIVADCPYSNIYRLNTDFAKQKHMPKWLIAGLCNFIFRVKYQFDTKEMSPDLWIKNNEVPVLFLHGLKDTFIRPYHSDILLDADGGEKEQHLFKNGTHANSVFDDAKEYETVIREYVEKQDKKS